MVDLFGGAEPFGAALEEFFSRSALGRAARPNSVLPDTYYWHGNEPDLHTAWLFYASADPSRRYHWLRQIQTRLYGNGPDGLPGNDDGGTLSAWYLFAAVGLFPIAGTDTFILGNPIVPLATLPLVGGEGLRIEAPGASPARGFVASTTLNGAPYSEPTITHAQLRGATLRFEMTDAP
jgi:putative alpha-1,2-mannosidase